MSQFFKKFLAEEGIGSSLALGAFGKHPGWDDHVEDLGLETETLSLAKHMLYIQGVGGQIDRGAWEKLDPANRTEAFNHIFLWQRSGNYLLGKMWSSSDGKGRTRYPMVICAHCTGTSLAWGLEKVLPRLEEVEKACKQAVTAADVRTILGRARNELRAGLGPASRGEYAPVSFEALTRYIADPGFSADQHGWFRILYQIQSQMPAFHVGQFNPRSDGSAWRPQQLRVPVAGRFPAESLLLWTRFINVHIDRQVPCLFLLSPGEPYLDIILGEPTTQEFFCLRARPAVLPLTNDVPYELDDDFKSNARRALSDFQAGKERPIATPPEDEQSGGWSSFTQRWFKGKASKLFLVIGICVVLAGAGSLAVMKLSSKQEALKTTTVASVNNAKPEVAPVGKQAAPVVKQGELPVAPISEPKKSVLIATANPSPVLNVASTQPEAAKGTAAPGPPVDLAPKETISAAAPATPVVTGASKPTQPTNNDRAPPIAVASLPAPTPTGPAPEEKPKPTLPTTGAVQVLAAAQIPSTISTVAPSKHQVARQPFTNSVGMSFVWVSNLAGTVDGGWAGRFEVTQAEFERITGANPSKAKNPGQPVESLTWQEAVDFCRRLTDTEKAAGSIPPGFVYSLPAQTQWDSLITDARFEDNVTSRASPRTAPAMVGSMAPNRLGLADLLGNVWEWCLDADAQQKHVARGGGFDSKSTFKFKAFDATAVLVPIDPRNSNIGFRCVLIPE